MSINKRLYLLLFLLTGCQSTQQEKLAETKNSAICEEVGIKLSFSPKLARQSYIIYQELSDFVSEQYPNHRNTFLEIELIKAYISPGVGDASLRASVVVKQNKKYFRGSDVDINMVGDQSEYQEVIHSALTQALDKAIHSQQIKCMK